MGTIRIDADAVWHASGLCDSDLGRVREIGEEGERREREASLVELKREIEQGAERRGRRVVWVPNSNALPCWALAVSKLEVYAGCQCDRECDNDLTVQKP